MYYSKKRCSLKSTYSIERFREICMLKESVRIGGFGNVLFHTNTNACCSIPSSLPVLLLKWCGWSVCGIISSAVISHEHGPKSYSTVAVGMWIAAVRIFSFHGAMTRPPKEKQRRLFCLHDSELPFKKTVEGGCCRHYLNLKVVKDFVFCDHPKKTQIIYEWNWKCAVFADIHFCLLHSAIVFAFAVSINGR